MVKKELSKCCGKIARLSVSTRHGRRLFCELCGKPFIPASPVEETESWEKEFDKRWGNYRSSVSKKEWVEIKSFLRTEIERARGETLKLCKQFDKDAVRRETIAEIKEIVEGMKINTTNKLNKHNLLLVDLISRLEEMK